MRQESGMCCTFTIRSINIRVKLCSREGQTCQTISSGVGVPIDWLLAHNPDLVCAFLVVTSCIPVILTSNAERQWPVPAPAHAHLHPQYAVLRCSEYMEDLLHMVAYTPTCEIFDVATKTTCETDPILPKWNLTKDQFVQLNDDVDETSCALIIGQEVISPS